MSGEPERPTFPSLYEQFDRRSPIVNEHFAEVNADLLEHCPVAHGTTSGGVSRWLISRFDDVRQAGQSRTFTTIDGLDADKTYRWAPEEFEDPIHTPLRRLMDAHLSLRTLSARKDDIREIANRLIDGFSADGTVDVIGQFATLLAGETYCSLITGMPAADVPMLVDWYIERFYGATPDDQAAATWKAYEYHGRYMADRREQPPRGDIVDAIIGWEHEGFTWEDKVGCLTLLTEGGLLTTGSVMGEGLMYLATNTADRERLLAEPARIERAVEEWLRTAASAFAIGRRIAEDTEIAGVGLKAGDWAYLNFAAANLDPRKFDDPHTTDLDRWPNPHVAFGIGRHRCPGSHLARINLQVGMAAFLERIPEFRLADGFTPTYTTGPLRVLDSLPLTFEPRPAGGAR